MTLANMSPDFKEKVKKQIVYAEKFSDCYAEIIHADPAFCYDNLVRTLDTLAKIGYKLAPLEDQDFESTTGKSVLFYAYITHMMQNASSHYTQSDVIHEDEDDPFKDDVSPDEKYGLSKVEKYNFSVMKSLMKDLNLE